MEQRRRPIFRWKGYTVQEGTNRYSHGIIISFDATILGKAIRIRWFHPILMILLHSGGKVFAICNFATLIATNVASFFASTDFEGARHSLYVMILGLAEEYPDISGVIIYNQQV